MPLLGRQVRKRVWKNKPIHAAVKPTRHLFQLGMSGAGKTLSGYRIVQQIAAQVRQGNASLFLFDGLSVLKNYCLTYLCQSGFPPERLCLIDPTFHPDELGHVLMHFLAVPKGVPEDEVVEGVVAYTEDLSQTRYDAGFRQLNLTRFGSRALLQAKRPLRDFARFCTHARFRKEVLASVTHRPTLEYWQGFEKDLRADQRRGWLESVLNKWTSLCDSSFTGPIIGETRSTVDFYQSALRGDIVISDVSARRLKPELAMLFAQLQFSQLETAILQLADVPRAERKDVWVICDEFSLLPVRSVESLYRTARNASVGILVMTQDLGPFRPEALSSFLANASTIVAMTCSDRDADRLVNELFSISGQQRRSWTQEQYYSHYEERLIAMNRIKEQEPGQAVVRIKPKDLYFMTVPQTIEPVPDPEKEWAYREAIAKHWYYRPEPEEPGEEAPDDKYL